MVGLSLKMKKCIEWVKENWEKWISWGSIRAIHNSKFISSMYLWLFVVPVVKKMLSKINEPFEFSFGNIQKVYTFDLQSPFSWDMFFYSALFFVVGNTIFFIASPELIKYFRDYGEYLGSRRNIRHLGSFVPKELREKRKSFDEIKKLAGIESKQFASDSDEAADLFWKLYNDSNNLRKKARIACFCFYMLGFFLFILVVINNIAWVISNSLL
jgi:hypothetical protein